MTITEHLHIDCPPAVAFDLMADVRKLTDWNDAASRADMTTTEPIGEGSSFTVINRGQEMTSTITTFDRPHHLGFSVTGKAMDVVATFRFQPAATGTELVIEFEPAPKGVMKLLFPLLRPLIRRDLTKQHTKFKDYCEARTQPHDA